MEEHSRTHIRLDVEAEENHIEHNSPENCISLKCHPFFTLLLAFSCQLLLSAVESLQLPKGKLKFRQKKKHKRRLDEF